MKKFVSIICCLISVISCFSEEKKLTGWEKDGLKGKVKECRDYSRDETGNFLICLKKYDFNGCITEDHYYNPFDGTPSYSYLYKYDVNKNEIEKIEKHHDPRHPFFSCKYISKYNDKCDRIECLEEYNADSLRRQTKYRYDSKCNLISLCEYDEKGEMYRKIIYKYDRKGNRTKEKDMSLYGITTVYKYDGKDNVIEKCAYYDDGELLTKVVFKYDENGKTIESRIYECGIDKEYKFKYDADGNKIETIYSSSDNVSNYRRVMKYDEGKMIDDNYYSIDEGILYLRYTYKYDAEGNEIECCCFRKNELIVKSIYEYDAKGNVIKKITKNYKSGFTFEDVNEYDYYE